MKKILLFALAAMTLAFVACDKKDKKKSEPEQNPLVGTWQNIEEYGDVRKEVKYTFDGSNNFSYSDYKYMGGQVHFGQIFKGSYRIDGDMVYVHYTGSSWTNDGEHIEEQTDFAPYDANFKYSISGNTLTIIRGEDTETYTKQ